VDTDAFAAGEYAVFCSLTISDVNPAGFCGAFKLRTAGTAAFMVGLIDDAITAGKFDESTAFPLKSADTGSTAVARTGADSDTLETLSDQLDDIPTATENADALLKRDWTEITGEAARSVLNALRLLRNKWRVSGTILTVTKENDSTSAWTATVTTSESADTITGSDPD
jgi:hypothetical protein